MVFEAFDIVRAVLALLCGAAGFTVSALNIECVVIMLRERRYVSLVPLFGGPLVFVAVLLAPIQPPSALAWLLPFVDPGLSFYVLHALSAGVR